MKNNIAFIDGQNLHLGLTDSDWKADYKKFRHFLTQKFSVTEAYYFLGYIMEENTNLYYALQKSGFIVSFREHSQAMAGKKKGNVDVEIVFEMMRNLIDNPENFDKIVLVSGDGDYKKCVEYLIKKDKFLRVLFPSKHHSSLYKKIDNKYKLRLEDIKNKIGYEVQK